MSSPYTYPGYRPLFHGPSDQSRSNGSLPLGAQSTPPSRHPQGSSSSSSTSSSACPPGQPRSTEGHPPSRSFNPPLGSNVFSERRTMGGTTEILFDRMQKDRAQRLRLGQLGERGSGVDPAKVHAMGMGGAYQSMSGFTRYPGAHSQGQTMDRMDGKGRQTYTPPSGPGPGAGLGSRSGPPPRQENKEGHNHGRQPYHPPIQNRSPSLGGSGPISSSRTPTPNSSQVLSLNKLSSLFDSPAKMELKGPSSGPVPRIPQTEPLSHAVPRPPPGRPEVSGHGHPRPSSAPLDPRPSSKTTVTSAPTATSPRSPLGGSGSSNNAGGIDMLLRAAAERVQTPSVTTIGNPMEIAGESIDVSSHKVGSKTSPSEVVERANDGGVGVNDEIIVLPPKPAAIPGSTGRRGSVDRNIDQMLRVPSKSTLPRRKNDKSTKGQPDGETIETPERTVKKEQGAPPQSVKKKKPDRSFSSDDSDLTSLSDDDPLIIHVQPVTNGGTDQPRKSGRQRKPNTRLVDQIAQADQETRRSQKSVEPGSRPGSGSSSAQRPKRMASDAAQVKIDQAVEKFGPVRSGSEQVRSREVDMYDLEQEIAASQQAGVKTESTVMVVDAVDPGRSPAVKRKRAASPGKTTPEIQPGTPNGRRRPMDVDAEYSETPRASPKRHKLVKRKAIVVQSDSDDEERSSARYTSPIHGRRKVQRQNYNEVELQGRYDAGSPDVTTLEGPIVSDATRRRLDSAIDGQGGSVEGRRAACEPDAGLSVQNTEADRYEIDLIDLKGNLARSIDADAQAHAHGRDGTRSDAHRTGGRKSKSTDYKPDLGPNTLVQDNKCLANRYAVFPRCGQCVAKTSYEKCRFQNWRLFPIDPNTGKITGQPYFGNVPLQPPVPLHFPGPSQFNRVPTAPDAFYLQQTVVRWLLPLFAREVQHVVQDGALCKPDDDESRLVCDFCATTVFGGSWSCSHCAKEYCLDCKRLLFEFKHPDELQSSAMHWQKDAGTRLLRCTKIGGTSRVHFGSCMIPVTRYDPIELKKDWAALVGFVTQSRTAYGETLPDLALPFQQHLQAVSIAMMRGDKSPLPGQEAEETRSRATLAVTVDELSSLTSNQTFAAQPVDRAGLASHSFFRLSHDKLSGPIFDAMWMKGVPLVVDGIGERFRLDWTPQNFYERTNEDDRDQVCYVVDCQAHEGAEGSLTEMRVADFFAEYIKGPERTERIVKKLKDWPAYTEFREKFPDLYDDFHQAMPVPDYTRRDGVLNISAHFPHLRGVPDIGPKMYNAFAAEEGPGGRGSTRLHMDMADAINVLMHANPREDGSPGCAVWDIFRPEDADGLREFLLEKYAGLYKITDPIHSQQFYLDSEGRQELFEKKGIYSYRIYQYTGQAIMVPAGCAHQVCNLADCMKIACDFVSPQNVKRCEKLSREFRSENNSRVWKDDVLQLSNMNWYAWCSSRALAGYKEETTSDPILNAEVERLFATLPRDTRLQCKGLNHDLALLRDISFKEPLGKTAASRVVNVRQTMSARRTIKKPDPPAHVINVDAAETSASPAPVSAPIPAPVVVIPPPDTTTITAGPPKSPLTPSVDQQAHLKVVLDRMAEEVVEAGSVSDLTNKDVVKGILAVAIRRSGLVLPEGFMVG